MQLRTTLVDIGPAMPAHSTDMLFMVMETFKEGPDAVGKRFQGEGSDDARGRHLRGELSGSDGDTMLPVEMRAPERAILDEWIAHWSDLVDFEVVPVLTSQEFWADRR
jgi:hypothetical protein